ncbi:MAG: hypothetical protein ABI480_08020 [Chitinophagaceae bacterium]
MKKVSTKKLLAMLCTGVIGISLFYACKKKELPPPEQKTVIKEKFFEIPPGTDSTVAAIACSVKRQNDKRNFLPRLIENAGLPVWNKAKVMMKSPEEGKQVFIPFILESKKTTRAILIVKLKGTDTLYHLLYNTQARQYRFDTTGTTGNWNARDIFHAFIVFDYELFGYTKFTVHEKKLINDTVGDSHMLEILKTGNSPEARENNTYPVTTWVTFVTCGLCGFKNTDVSTSRCCNAEYNLVPVTYWFNEEDDSWGYYTPEGGFQLGGGGGPAGSMCVGCNWEDSNPCALDQYGHAVGFCDEDWEPTSVLTQVYNPLAYDSITVGHQVQDSFPCLYNLLTDDMEKINQQSQLMLSSIFGVNLYNHLHFQMNYTFTKDSAIMGTKPGRREWNDDQMSFYDTVEINPYYALHATKEQLIAATIHESIHAYINWCFLAYTNEVDGIDSNYLKTHFPFHWDYFTNRGYSSTTQHDLMASNYINEIVNAVVAGGNQSASLLLRTYVGTALAYSGLHETSIWNNLSSTDKCNYEGIQDWSQHYDQPSNFHYDISGCRSYGISFRDSLHLLGRCQ